ncbi:MAG: hypothetical protein QM698_13150 [Micropepsaceae bacterium]
MTHRRLVTLGAFLMLGACATPPNIIEPSLHDNNPTVRFTHCNGYGCSSMYGMKFSQAEWDEIGAFFIGTRDAADERARIALAMSRFEQIAGPKDGTENDTGGTGWISPGYGHVDCYAEAANTTVAIQMMQKSGFLKYHVVDQPTMRGVPFGTFGLVHATATIKEISDGHLWVVDTWFFDNGGPTFVIDRDEWRGGWHPEGGATI